MNSADCKAEFRVEKADLPPLTDALHIPAEFQRSICDSLEGLCVLLRRTSFLCRFSDMIQCFPRPVSVLSLISNEVTDFIYDNHCDLVSQWNRDILSWVALQQCAETISRKGSLLNNWFGFIDAPEIFIASISLRKAQNEYKRTKTRIYSRFLHTVKTSLLRSAPRLDDLAPDVQPQTEIKRHFRAPSPSRKLSVLN